MVITVATMSPRLTMIFWRMLQSFMFEAPLRGALGHLTGRVRAAASVGAK